MCLEQPPDLILGNAKIQIAHEDTLQVRSPHDLKAAFGGGRKSVGNAPNSRPGAAGLSNLLWACTRLICQLHPARKRPARPLKLTSRSNCSTIKGSRASSLSLSR